jgi:hypothetical protein
MADIEASLSVKVQFCEVAKKLNDEKTKCDVKERKKEEDVTFLLNFPRRSHLDDNNNNNIRVATTMLLSKGMTKN